MAAESTSQSFEEDVENEISVVLALMKRVTWQAGGLYEGKENPG